MFLLKLVNFETQWHFLLFSPVNGMTFSPGMTAKRLSTKSLIVLMFQVLPKKKSNIVAKLNYKLRAKNVKVLHHPHAHKHQNPAHLLSHRKRWFENESLLLQNSLFFWQIDSFFIVTSAIKSENREFFLIDFQFNVGFIE